MESSGIKLSSVASSLTGVCSRHMLDVLVAGEPVSEGHDGVAALAIAQHPKDTNRGTGYQRLVIRRGKSKALVATERSILNAVWHMLAKGGRYHEAGADFFALKDPDRVRRNVVR